jgi:hypothetical protein
MMNSIKNIIRTSAMMCMGIAALTSCTDGNDWSIDSAFDRLFSVGQDDIKVTPAATTAEVEFSTVKDAEYYVIEVDTDSLFATQSDLYRTYQVKETPATIDELESATKYFIRIKAMSSAKAESKWTLSSKSFKTEAENIFFDIDVDNDITATTATLKWPANSKVTSLTYGDEVITLTTEQISTGSITLTGLTPETSYTVRLFNGEKQRGEAKIKTAIDLGGATLVKAGESLEAAIEAAEDGATLALMPGTYVIANEEGLASSTTISKNISIKSVKSGDRAIIKGGFDLTNNASLLLSQVVLDGDNQGVYPVRVNEAGTYQNITIDDCELRNFKKDLLYINVKAYVGTITINNSVIHGFSTSSEFIDIRTAGVKNIKLTNSTWYDNGMKDFLRIDNASANFTDWATSTNITINHNTFDGIGSSAKGYLYVRYPAVISFTNNIMSNCKCYWASQKTTAVPTFNNNNYYNSELMVTASTSSKFFDESGTKENPQYTSETDFTVGNASVKAANQGDPRWIQ